MTQDNQPQLFPYQVIGVRGAALCTLRSFWARDDAHAKEQAGVIPLGAMLVREVER